MGYLGPLSRASIKEQTMYICMPRLLHFSSNNTRMSRNMLWLLLPLGLGEVALS